MSELALYSVTSLRDFDPRCVPVSHVDAELSALNLEWLTPDNLRRHFLHPPPWQPEIAAERRFTDRPITHASVLIPIVAGGGCGGRTNRAVDSTHDPDVKPFGAGRFSWRQGRCP